MLRDTLKELRNDKNLTQKELSEKLGLSKNAVCEYEKGRAEPSIETLIELSKIFGVSVDYLVGIEDDFGNVAVNINANLSPEEKTLLELFNQLPDVRRRTIIDTMRFMVDSNKSAAMQNKISNVKK